MAQDTAGISDQAKQQLAEALGGSTAASANGKLNGSAKDAGAAGSVRERVTKILADATGVEHEEITDRSTLSGHLGVDSLTLVDVAVRLEEEFNVRIEDEEIISTEQVGQLVELVESRYSESN